MGILVGSTVHDNQRRSGARSLSGGCPEICRVNHAVRAGQHLAAPVSGGQACAALATTARDDGAAGAGAHAQTEAVRLGTTTVVGLESPLGHDSTPRGERGDFPRSSVRCVDLFSECSDERQHVFAGEHRQTKRLEGICVSVNERRRRVNASSYPHVWMTVWIVQSTICRRGLLGANVPMSIFWRSGPDHLCNYIVVIHWCCAHTFVPSLWKTCGHGSIHVRLKHCTRPRFVANFTTSSHRQESSSWFLTISQQHGATP